MQITDLRGRDEECGAIRDLLDGADGGGALLVQGEPGSGRTALLAYAHRHAGDRTVLAGTGLADEAALPYAGLQRLLDPVRDRLGALPAPQRRVLRRALAGEGCPAGQRLTLSMAVLGLLAAVARERPLLCTMDDVDLGDGRTAEVLAFVARRLGHLPVVVVLTGAVDTAPGGIPTCRLRPLDERDSRAVLSDRLPVPASEPVAVALGTVAAGNPQALVDLAEALSPAQCRGEEPLPTTPPPDGVLGRGYRARLNRLPDDTRRLLLLAALDDGMDAATLVRAARVAGTVIEALAPAEVAGLVRVEARGVTFPQPPARAMVVATAPLAERRTAHLLLAALLDGTGHRLRRALHRAAAAEGPDPVLASELTEAARDEGSPDARSAALQRAAELSVDPASATARLVAAAHHAWAAGRPYRARLLTQHLPTGPTEPTVTARAELLHGEMELRCGRTPAALTALLAAADAAAGTAPDLALQALLRAGEAICFAGDQYRYADVARRARALRPTGASPGTELPTAHLAGVAATLRGDHEVAGPTLRRAVVLGDRLAGRDRTPTALTGAAVAALLVAEDGAAHRLADRAVELARVRGEVAALPRALELRAVAEYWLGRHEAAAETSREGLRIARSAGQDTWAGVHRGMLAVLAAVRADRETSLRLIREIGEEPAPGSRPDALARWALAVLDLLDGRPEDAAERLAALARPGTGRGQVTVQVMATPYLVEAAAASAHRPAAVAALAVFDRWADSTASPSRRALSARCHALLAPRGSAAAEEGFRTALRRHPPGAGAFERARTEFLLGRELRRSRRPRDARRHLHDARETFTRLGATAWADQAAAELRAAGESVGGPDRTAARLLTGQQLRVAQLVAEGATNREVADRMFLSTRTVDHHLRNIFHRLGIRSRTQLARVL
ncbi:helix-turn-helix transcriptional regulator [Micromonospora sagamiensis]|uniref:helix-turn-helix transcriptional regulator n=1 Tax=Micromonospora sagamiensis TaxID=47875 RepID=UPI0018613D7D|nr:LuxR family transcriptional regulator [Micromonospora sagamiensis]BCL17392.1 transcriptional regulator [Micromonospora sagamiensis]